MHVCDNRIHQHSLRINTNISCALKARLPEKKRRTCLQNGTSCTFISFSLTFCWRFFSSKFTLTLFIFWSINISYFCLRALNIVPFDLWDSLNGNSMFVKCIIIEYASPQSHSTVFEIRFGDDSFSLILNDNKNSGRRRWIQ